jgi:hypothetical protein
MHRFTADLALVGAGARLRRPGGSAARFARHDRITAVQIVVRSGGKASGR